ncbi:MAG TPA: helix-turn-helix transcriptional regulator [Candidatus Sulfotelmatobacter sp.]|nr:helix-turn-helix transcriptional regulator [Candidatus Sulfotelmatobacter sp.]
MSTRQRSADRAALRSRRSLATLGEEIRTARSSGGLSLAVIGEASGVSAAHVSRLERGMVHRVDLVALARIMATVGLDLSLRAYPGGRALRDQAHLALLTRLRTRLAPVWRCHLEVPVVGHGDPRAWDLVARLPTVGIAFEGEMKLYDVQAQTRRQIAKFHDGSVDRLILVVADTRHNAVVLRDARTLLAGDFPLDTRTVLAALGAGRDPGANGIVVL